jgi:RNase P subunit RPR2
MSLTIADNSTLAVETCYKCGMRFAMPEHFQRTKRIDQSGFFCPSGHIQYYVTSRVQQLEKQVARLQATNDQSKAALDQKRQELYATERKLIAQKAAKTRLKNRIKNGVCPCCNRFFKELHQHMATQHPEFVPGND